MRTQGRRSMYANTSITSLCMYLFHSHVTCSATSITNTSFSLPAHRSSNLLTVHDTCNSFSTVLQRYILYLLVFTQLSSFSLSSHIQLSIISSHPVQVLIAALDVPLFFEQCYCPVSISLLSLTNSLSLHLILKSHYYM